MNMSFLWRNKIRIRKTLLFQLFLGQVVSFNLAIISFTTSLVSTQVDAPLTQSIFTYLALALVYGSIMLYNRHKLMVPWYWYVLLGFVDVHGNYFVNKAYQFTSITSATILDCWTIPWAMILTWLFLGTIYSFRQFFGAAICLAGLGVVLLSDAGVAGGGGSKPLLGDFLVITGTLFYAMSNVGEEFCVKRKNQIEVIAMIGLFGMLISASEMAVLERKNIASVQWSAELMSAFAAYTLATFLFYTIVPFVLKISGATMFNLSLLTSDMWAVVIRIFIYKQKVGWLYYLAFAIVIIGIFIYSKTEEDTKNTPALDDVNPDPEYSIIDENPMH